MTRKILNRKATIRINYNFVQGAGETAIAH